LALSHDGLRAVVAKEREARRRAGTIAEAVRDANVFALTWDDAHRSLYTDALPLLRDLDVPGTVFVPTLYVGTSDEFMTWDELRALRDAGWTIGSHTTRHARMSWRFYDEDVPAQRERLDRECGESRALLEAKLGIAVKDFAYPYGETTPDAIAAVRVAGYERAFTVRDSLAWDGDVLTVPRLDGMEAHGLMRARSSEPTKISVVVPACDRHEMLTEIVARWSAQSYPNDAFEVIVVDDGSRTSLRPCFEKAAPNVRLVDSPGSDATFRAGQTRERGAALANFETLAFLDADIAVGDDFLWHLDWIHQRVDDAVVLGYLSGYNLHDIGFTHSIDAIRGGCDPDKTLAIIPDRSREPTLRGCLDNVDWLAEPWRLAYTGNLSLTKRALDAIGGFATAFTGWGLEDLDLGYRLHRAGFPFVFSRFAVGYHLVDANEGAPRNPFRAANPTRERFAGYEKNLATLASLHHDDPTIAQFVASAHADIEETCGKPDTIGVEFGGLTELECAFHRHTHRTQPGGLDEHELLDRLAYAVKVGARSLYLLGGDPALHPFFVGFLETAKRAGIRRITSETQGLPFARDGFARAARGAGLDHAILEVFALEANAYDSVTRTHGRFADFEAAFDALAAAGIHRTSKIVVTHQTIEHLAATIAALKERGILVDEVVALDAALHHAALPIVRAAGLVETPLRVPRS
jgi:GT2 family glycosyltransferase/peptidoglycan/xylan/chitin deacetylase (PgdA/CDA1 family)